MLSSVTLKLVLLWDQSQSSQRGEGREGWEFSTFMWYVCWEITIWTYMQQSKGRQWMHAESHCRCLVRGWRTAKGERKEGVCPHSVAEMFQIRTRTTISLYESWESSTLNTPVSSKWLSGVNGDDRARRWFQQQSFKIHHVLRVLVSLSFLQGSDSLLLVNTCSDCSTGTQILSVGISRWEIHLGSPPWARAASSWHISVEVGWVMVKV